MFAKTFIKKDTIIGEYTGLIWVDPDIKKFAWLYNTKILNFNVDSMKYGNLLRFANDLDEHNLEVKMIPYKNRWHIIYKTIEDIEVGE